MPYSNYFIKREAKGGGDCFFDSMAQALSKIMPRIGFSAKSVREDCAKYVQDLLKAGKDLPDWIMRNFGQPRDNNGQTIGEAKEYQSIQYSLEECPRPIWGLPEVEGRILCEIYGVELHLIERYVIKGQEIYVDTFINESSNSQSPNKANKENTIHIINPGTSHFEPLFEERPGAYGDYLTSQGLSDDINPASGTTSQNAISNQAKKTDQPGSAEDRTNPVSGVISQSETHGTLSAPEKRASEIAELLNHITPEERSEIAKSAKALRDSKNPFAPEFYIQEILKNIPEKKLKELVIRRNSLACAYVRQPHTTDSAVSRPAILGATNEKHNATLANKSPVRQSRTTDSAVPRPSILDMTEKKFNATLANVERTKLEIDHKNQFEGVHLGKGCQNPYKPQKQKGNGGESAGLAEGIVGYLLHNEPLARASSEQKDHYYAATRGGAQRESQGRQASGGLYPISPAPSESNKRNPEVPTSTKSDIKRPESSRPNVVRPNPPRPNAKPPKSFLRALATVFHNKTPNYEEARNKGRGFINVPKRQG